MSYRDALLASRLLMGSLEEDAAKRVQAALRAYADHLTRVILQGGGTLADEAALRATMAAARTLDRELARAVARGRAVSFDGTLRAWRDAMHSAASAEGVSGAALGRIRVPPLSMLGQFANLQGGKHWRTLVREHSIRAGEEASRILTFGAQEGIGAEEMARRMRRYVTGSEPFRALFEEVETPTGQVAKLDLRRLPAELRGATQQMVHSSRRIAFSELHNARAEAEIQHMHADPFVAAVQWTLSPVRSTVGWKAPCECDYLARNNLYGLGPGTYPVAAVPPPPHPWDRCEKMPVTRPASEIARPKPTGTAPSEAEVRFGGFIPDGDRITPAHAARIRENAWSAIQFGREVLRRASAA